MNIRDLAKARVIVIGDAMIDRWVWGHYSKIGPEGVPVFLQHDVEDRPGGAANVLANLEALGCDARLFAKPPQQRPVKTRYAVTGAVFRSDKEDCSPIDETLVRGYMGFLDAIERPQVLVISDYAKGVCTPSLCQKLIGWAKAKGVKVVVDPKGDDWSKYTGADVITPNEVEYTAVAGKDWNCGPADLVMTRGAAGMSILPFDASTDPAWKKNWINIPATAREVYDVTGAGDTVVAVLAASLAVGFDLETAARMANAAAGVVVGKRGTATCSLEELEQAYQPEAKRTPVIGFTNGCFDLLHEGHRHFLTECMNLCDRLIVAINSDESVRALKGSGRPRDGFNDRIRNVGACLRLDDQIIGFKDEAHLRFKIEAHKPDFIFKGQEYETKDVVGADLARVVLIPMLEGHSTTLEIARRA